MNYHVTLEIRYYGATQQIEICMSQTEITIKKAKGRPMLTWVGKKPLTRVRAYPAQAVESFTEETLAVAEGVDWSQWPDSSPQGGLLFHGDNKDVLAHLLANGFRNKVKLIYIDPPFDSGADYVRKVELRGAKGTTKLDGEEYTLGEQIQYTDIWANDNYLQFMYERLQMLKDLLAEDGSIYLHCDWKRVHLLRCIMDEVFGAENFRNELVRVKCNPKNSKRKAFGNVHDNLLFYVKGEGPQRTWNIQREEVGSEDIKRLFDKTNEEGRAYTTVALHAKGERKGETGQQWRGISPPIGRHWAYVHKELDRLDSVGLIEWSSTNNPRLIRYADENNGNLIQDIWTMKDPVADEYPTEKPSILLERIITGSSNTGDLILDCFVGSGTSVDAAQKLGRRWIGCDINKGSIQTTSKRLQATITQQAQEAKRQQTNHTQGSLLPETTENNESKPAQNNFHVNRVNDYDLQIQHNEAVDLVSDHLGITRNRTDSDFDGTLGNKLVKIIPFNHPLSPPDIEEVKRVLSSRPEEERNIVMVCLGTEIAARAVIEQHNKNRPINKLEIIELRTHPKYGGIIKHEPLSAEISVKKEGQELIITIEDVLSPSILQRLNKDEGLFRAQITDWRAQVDTVLIDTNYSGEVFNITHSDVPERKKDMVLGEYCVPLPAKGSVIAVKIIDMLGEEVICVETLSK